MVKCSECGSKNDNNNDYCSECGNNLNPLFETSKFNKKAISLGVIILFFLLVIRNVIHFDTLILWTLFMIFSFFISGVITGYTTNRLYISSAILNGLVVGIIFSTIIFISIAYQNPVIFSYTYIILFLMIIFCGLGGGVGGYIKIQRKIK